MTTHVFLIRTLTNLHAGSGDSGGTGVVDKLVQRDPTTTLPTIHASGIKGALREHFEGGQLLDTATSTKVFGSNPKDRADDKIKPGSYRFFAADLLALPEPQDEAPHFRRVGDQANANQIQARLRTLGATEVTLDLMGHEVHTLTAGQFADAAKELPVIARNYLDNGISKNLWYEEVVPRETLFVTCIQAPEGDTSLTALLHNTVVQLGGNATVGYGFCLFTQLSPKPAAKDEKAS